MQGWKRIEKYQFNLNKIIGEGSYATVYWGKSIENGENVAIKVIDKKLFLNAYNLKNIQSQIDIMKMVNHENIVKLYDIYQTTNNMYIITEFCEDGDLYRFLLQRRKLTEAEAKKYLKQILRGAKYLHSNGIIHRDLKPANILMKSGVCKISDFGFAKSLSQQNVVMKSIVGTPLYMSPQILKRTKYTAKSDLWSIGLMYYEMLNGRTPWPAHNQIQLINGIYSKKPAFQKQISQASIDFILKCLQIEEVKRIGWDEVFQHRIFEDSILKNNKKIIVEEKENFITNLTGFRSKRETIEGGNIAKIKKGISEKQLKNQNFTPSRQRITKTPQNVHQIVEKANRNKIKPLTPKKWEAKTQRQQHP